MKSDPMDKVNVTERFYGRPILVDETFATYLYQQHGNQLYISHDSAAAFPGIDANEEIEQDRIAVINVSGTLVHGYDVSWGDITGYPAIERQIAAAEADPSVAGIALHINSHGGEVAGCFECAAAIRSTTKPTMAIVGSYAHSAAYALASAADEIVMPETGSVGSIGVVTMHTDMSGMLDSIGVKPTFIFAGKHKVDGNPYEPLSDSVKADIQERIDSLYTVFVDTVATNRGIESQSVRDTEARTFSSQDAISAGLADAVMAPRDALVAFRDELFGSQNSFGGISMSNHKDGAEVSTQAPENAEVVDVQKVTALAKADERARISEILGCEEAEGRETLAKHLALSTDQSAEAAKGILAAAPVEAAPAPAASANSFAAAMEATGNPEVGTEGSAETEDEPSAVAMAFAAFDKATGRKTH